MNTGSSYDWNPVSPVSSVPFSPERQFSVLRLATVLLGTQLKLNKLDSRYNRIVDPKDKQLTARCPNPVLVHALSESVPDFPVLTERWLAPRIVRPQF